MVPPSLVPPLIPIAKYWRTRVGRLLLYNLARFDPNRWWRLAMKRLFAPGALLMTAVFLAPSLHAQSQAGFRMFEQRCDFGQKLSDQIGII